MPIPMNDFVRQVAQMRADLEAAFARVLDSGWLILGKEVEAFERELADFCGAPYAVGVGNGMDAIELALRGLDVGAGAEVITSPNSAFASGLAIVRAGARPVFADIDPATYAIDPKQVEALITPRTRAIVPVHIYGQAADLDELAEIARKHDLILIGDAAQAHGAKCHGKPVSAYGAATCYSFYPTKNLGAFGDGGAIVTHDRALAEKLRTLRNYGQTVRYVHEEIGLNSRLDEVQAALLRVKLRYLPGQNARRAQIAARYSAGLAGLPLQLPTERIAGESVWHLYVIRTPKRDALSASLKECGITTLIHYPKLLPHQAALAPLEIKGSWPVAERCAAEFLSLPIFPEMTDAEVDEVIAGVRAFFGASRG